MTMPPTDKQIVPTDAASSGALRKPTQKRMSALTATNSARGQTGGRVGSFMDLVVPVSCGFGFGVALASFATMNGMHSVVIACTSIWVSFIVSSVVIGNLESVLCKGCRAGGGGSRGCWEGKPGKNLLGGGCFGFLEKAHVHRERSGGSMEHPFVNLPVTAWSRMTRAGLRRAERYLQTATRNLRIGGRNSQMATETLPRGGRNLQTAIRALLMGGCNLQTAARLLLTGVRNLQRPTRMLVMASRNLQTATGTLPMGGRNLQTTPRTLLIGARNLQTAILCGPAGSLFTLLTGPAGGPLPDEPVG